MLCCFLPRFFGVNYFFCFFNSLSQKEILTAQMARIEEFALCPVLAGTAQERLQRAARVRLSQTKT